MVRRMRNEELGTRRRLRKRIKPHPKEEAMSRPQVTVRRVGRRPTAIRNSTRPPGTTRSLCHPERGRPTAESKDDPASPESVPELGSLSSFGGSLDSQSSLGMTRGGSPSLATPKRNRLPDRAISDREPQSGDRYLAWGVSPRNRVKKDMKSPGGATDQRGAKMCRRDACTTKVRARLWCRRPARTLANLRD